VTNDSCKEFDESDQKFYESKNYTTMYFQIQDFIRKKWLFKSTPNLPYPKYLPPPDIFLFRKLKKLAKKKAISYQLKHLEEGDVTIKGDKFGGVSRMF
jgi:hypothetical protein